jgi:hypothetical protein
LYTETGIRKKIYHSFSGQAKLGLGYFHSIPDHKIFKQNSSGDWVLKHRFGRPQLFFSFAFGPAFDFSKALGCPLSVFLDYQIWFQTPFVTGYVPVLPNIALHLGVSYKLKGR